MPHWSWWAGGVALALVPIANWVLLRRILAVSGRFTALVDRLRHGPDEQQEEMSTEELIAALREATAREFGEDAVQPEAPAVATGSQPAQPATSLGVHAIFLLGLLLGGLASALLAGALEPTASLHGTLFASLSGGGSLPAAPWLLAGGVLVGFGTRMAGGCTSGHGLCGVSRFQPGSLLATVAFFATGVVTSFALGALL